MINNKIATAPILQHLYSSNEVVVIVYASK